MLWDSVVSISLLFELSLLHSTREQSTLAESLSTRKPLPEHHHPAPRTIFRTNFSANTLDDDLKNQTVQEAEVFIQLVTPELGCL